MWPLSIYNYYNNNRKRFLSIFISVTLSVILLYTLQMVIFSSFRTGYNTAVEPKKYYSTVAPKGEVLNQYIIDHISILDGVDMVIPCIYDYTTIHTGIGSNYSASILSLKMDTIPDIMKLLNLKIVDGRLPEKNSEIILHKQVAANKKLKIGDLIGREVSESETLPGNYTIVGIIDGTSIVSFAPIEYYYDTYQLNYDYIYGGLILPKEGSLKEMNQVLDSMTPVDYSIDTLTVEKASDQIYTTRVGIFMTIIDIFIILIVSSCIGFLSYIYFSQRRSEFGLLCALGFSRQKVINRAFAEINGINLIGYLCGIGISFLLGMFMNYSYFNVIGDPLQIINIKYLLGAACSPILVTLFSLIPIWRMLKKLDPITIIDGTTM